MPYRLFKGLSTIVSANTENKMDKNKKDLTVGNVLTEIDNVRIQMHNLYDDIKSWFGSWEQASVPYIFGGLFCKTL